LIELSSVSKTYGEGPTSVRALASIDLRVRSGEFVGIMGPSGSGKSTLLNLVAALETPTSGRIVVGGKDIAALDDDALTAFRRKRVGLVFQSFNLLPTLDALDNVLVPVLLERRVTAEDRRRAEGLLDEVGLSARRGHRITELSGGETQRVALARALVNDPALVLADEPTGNLDTKAGDAVLELLSRACRSRGTTVVMVTHDARAAAVGDRVIFMRDGRIEGDHPRPADGGTRS
jgi:putative ABC transport system ATP-binding protein